MELLLCQDPAPIRGRADPEAGQRRVFGGVFTGDGEMVMVMVPSLAVRDHECAGAGWAAQGPALPLSLQWPWPSPRCGCLGSPITINGHGGEVAPVALAALGEVPPPSQHCRSLA